MMTNNEQHADVSACKNCSERIVIGSVLPSGENYWIHQPERWAGTKEGLRRCQPPHQPYGDEAEPG